MKEENLEKLIIKILLKESLENCYTCMRSWSAWSYETMAQDDFIHLPEDDDLLDEIVSNLHPLYNENDTDVYLSAIAVEAYYNENIDRYFSNSSFHDDFLSYVDLDLLTSHKEVKECSLKDSKKMVLKSNKIENISEDMVIGFKMGIDYLKNKTPEDKIISALGVHSIDKKLEIIDGLKSSLSSVRKYGLNNIQNSSKKNKP